LWPLFGDDHADSVIDKLNHTGTHPAATDLAIVDAIRLHREIGSARKEERLRWLQRYWTDQVRELPRVRLFTPRAPQRTCAIATFGIDGIEPAELAKQLLARHRIFTVAIDRPAAAVRGVRVTPHLYTTTAELDALVAAIRELARA
jgi:selenocysteine lyase/cysteine desulfurase